MKFLSKSTTQQAFSVPLSVPKLSELRLGRLFLLLIVAFYTTFSFAYSSTSPQLRIEIGQHTGMINRLAINQAGTLLATASDDKTLRLWNLPAGTAYAVLRVPIGENLQGALYATALSPDGKTVLAAGETGNAKDKFSLYVFDVDKRVLKARIADLPSAIYHLSFDKTGQYFAASFAGGFGVKVWNSQTGQLVAEDTDYRERSTWSEFNEAGQLITVSHDGYIRLYDQQFKLVKKTAMHHQGIPYSIKIAPDQTKLAIGYSNLAVVDILDTQLNTLQSIELKDLNAAHNTAIVAWTADNGLMAAGNLQNVEGSYIIRRWPDISHPDEHQDISVSRNIITDLISLTGTTNAAVDVLFASAEPSWGSLKQNQIVYKNQPNTWDARIVELPQKKFDLSPDGMQIAYGTDSQSNQFQLFDLHTLQLQFNTKPEQLATLSASLTKHLKLQFSNWQRSSAPQLNGKVIKLDDFEKSLAVAIDPAASTALLGSNYRIRLFNAQGNVTKTITTPAEVYALNIAKDLPLVVAALGDGTIRWYSLQPSELLEELVTYFPYQQGKAWIAWTKEGFFAHADGDSHQLAGYQINKGDNKRPEWVSFTQLYQAYYAPELLVPKLLRQENLIKERLKEVESVNHRLTQRPVPVINLVEYCTNPEPGTTRAFSRQQQPLAGRPANPQANDNLLVKLKTLLRPVKTWIIAKLNNTPSATEQESVVAKAPSEPICYSLTGQGNTRAFARQTAPLNPVIYRNQFDQAVTSIKLRYTVQGREGGLGDIDVYVNGQIQHTQKSLVANSATDTQTYAQDLTLASGENHILINAYEASGGSAAQSPLLALLNPDMPEVAPSQDKPKIIVFAVGINAYAPPNQLQYAVKDASDFLSAVSQHKSDAYGEVLTFKLMDADATLSNIEATIDKMAKVVNKQDTVLVYLSGHGLKEGIDYYFMPQDVNDDNLSASALSQQRLKESMAKLAKTDHIFMFIDSCHSGAVDLAKINQDMSSFDKIKQQLGENIFILAASGSNQEAQDQFKLEGKDTANNGLFAYAVLEGLKGSARRMDDNIIDNYNLGTYVMRRVDALTQHQSLYKQKARFQMLEAGDVLTFDITKYYSNS